MGHPDELAQGLDRVWFSAPGHAVRAGISSALGLLSPTWCSGCGAQDTVFCASCAEDLHVLTRAPFPAEQQALALPLPLHTEEITVLPVTAAGRYEGLVSRAVLAFKDHAAVSLAAHLGPGLRRALDAAAERASGPEGSGGVHWMLISPPPSLRSRLARGFDPLQLLMRHALPACGAGPGGARAESSFTHVPGLLRHAPRAWLRSLDPRAGRQKSRGARARRSSLAGSIEVTARSSRLLAGADVLLIDDVLTSGSTLGELYRVLSAAGARVHGAAVLAAAPAPGAADESVLVSASPEA
ncbi:ComF family protein [Nesterenkonia lutea]|uniref:Amidophosphoribosyltransferase n=1 Tax=Nesterenkonia lutea TaxID=272919 RepID=A0ABR9JF09_9MICC|nr:phosphoribosyltransferase family protein [Nesterenkonia lutea]MBE1524514.1 putative amidophosphoribosyltransferase [Nesterenkonia lutea]